MHNQMQIPPLEKDNICLCKYTKLPKINGSSYQQKILNTVEKKSNTHCEEAVQSLTYYFAVRTLSITERCQETLTNRHAQNGYCMPHWLCPQHNVSTV